MLQPMDVSTPPKWSRYIPICLRNFQKKYLVYGALIGGRDIDLPTPPSIFSTWPSFGALALCPQLCQHLPGDLEMFLYVSGTSKKSLVHGTLIEAELLTSLPPIYVHNLAWFWVLALCQQVCQHLPSSLQMFLYLSGTIKKCLVNGALIETGVLTSTLSHLFAQLGLVFVCQCSTHRMCQHLPSSLEMFLCVSGTSK